MNSKGRSLELFFVDGNPDGMLTAEVFNWTGHLLRIPRAQLAEGIQRPEAKQTGVYVLLGEDHNGPLSYIGETEDMAERLKDHAKKRDWWDYAVLITTHGDALHKAHARFLERKLVERALETRVRPLENGNLPGGASLNEAATANMKSFLDTLYMVLPAIRVDMFQSGKRSSPDMSNVSTSEPAPSAQEFFLSIPRHKITAQARLIGTEMVVEKGSDARGEWVGNPKHNPGYAKLHETLIQTGVIRKNSDGQSMFAISYAFSSPSAAAAIISGRAADGPSAWKTRAGLSYKEWEAQQLDQAVQ